MSALEPCPNPSCDGVRPQLCSCVITRKDQPNWFVQCANCAMSGPICLDADAAEAGWNNLPRSAALTGWHPTHRHLKRESTYRVEGQASLQTSIPCEEAAVLVIYRDESGRLFARPHDEFHDGRFEVIGGADA